MKPKLISTVILFLLFFSINEKVFSQIPEWEWAKQVVGTGANLENETIAVDAFGNNYITGNFQGTKDFDPGIGVFNLTSTGDDDIFILKLDNAGNFIWAKKVGGTDMDKSNFIAIDLASNIYITGNFNGISDFDPGLAVFNLTSIGLYDNFVCKLDSNGNFNWAKAIGGSNGNESRAIALDALCNVYTTGWFTGTVDFDPGLATFNLTSAGPNSDPDIFVSKLDSSGNFIWAKKMGGAGNDKCYSISTDLSGSIYITGEFSSIADFDPGPGISNLGSAGGQDIFVSKLNSSGNFIWAQGIGGIHQEIGRAIKNDTFGNVYITGNFAGTLFFGGATTLTSNGDQDNFILKLNNSGIFIWAKATGGTTTDKSNSIAIDMVGNIYTSGYFYRIRGFDSNTDFDPGPDLFKLKSVYEENIYILKLSPSGNFLWAKVVGGNHKDIGLSIAIDINQNLFLTGTFNSDSISFGTTTLSKIASYCIFVAKLSHKPCSSIVCDINSYINHTNVSNSACNNGTIKVGRAGTFKAYPHIELYNISNTKIDSINLYPGLQNYTFTNLVPGHYLIKVFDYNCCEKDFVRNIKCPTPSTGFSATNITATSAQLNWDFTSCVLYDRVKYRLQGSNGLWFYKIAQQGISNISGLQPLSIYEWRVGTKCIELPDSIVFEYSPIQTFTTAALRIGEEQNVSPTESIEISLHPNPAAYTLTVNFETDASTATMCVMNTVGQVMFEKQLNGADGIYEEQLDISKLNTGIYMLQVKTQKGMSLKKFIKE